MQQRNIESRREALLKSISRRGTATVEIRRYHDVGATMEEDAQERLTTAVLTPFSDETLHNIGSRAFSIRTMQDPDVTVRVATRIVTRMPHVLHSAQPPAIAFATATIDGSFVQLLVENGVVNQILGVGVDKQMGDGLTWFVIGSSMVKGIGVYQKLTTDRVLGALENGNKIMLRTENPRLEYSLVRVLDNLTKQGVVQGYLLERVVLEGFYAKESALRIDGPEPSKSEEINAIYSQLDHNRADAFELHIAMRVDSAMG